jgi:predicted nucleic acid-binding protein
VTTYVVDANVIVQAAIDAAGLGPLDGHQLIAPPVMPSEALSSLSEMYYRGEISAQLAEQARPRLQTLPYEVRQPAGLFDSAWQLARQLGWAKTYDAEYVVLARILDCELVTLDGRLMRGAGHVARIISPGSVG